MSCSACNRKLGVVFNKGRRCELSQGGCGGRFCKDCCSYAVVRQADVESAMKSTPQLYCKLCFRNISTLDFSQNVEILGREAGTAPSLIFIHGGGGCRRMFLPHAEALGDSFHCVLIDLPGHGGRMDEPLSMSSALQTIHEAVETRAKSFRGMRPVLIGGSLGGYLIMEYLGLYPESVSAAVVCMAGQNVGLNRSCAASCGLCIMDIAVRHVDEAQLLHALVSTASKSKHMRNDWICASSLFTGMFFHQASAQTTILKQTQPAERLTKCQRTPILFVNGSKDHRDCEHRWLAAANGSDSTGTNPHPSKLIVYEEGDHFFTHDNRFSDRFIQDVRDFLNPLLISSTGSTAVQLATQSTPIFESEIAIYCEK